VTWIASLSVLLALPLYVVAFAVVAVAANTVVRLFVSQEKLADGHEVAGFLMGVVGVLYSVVLGFLVGTVWTAFATAQQTSDLEAGYVADAFGYAAQLPPPQSRDVQRTLARYAIYVRDTGGAAPKTTGSDPSLTLLQRAVHQALNVPPAPPNANPALVLERNTIQTGLIENLKNVADQRRLRLVQARSRLPAGMLEALLLGAVFVVVFVFFYGVKSYWRAISMTALLAGSIGLFFGLVIELSTPYDGPIQVSRDAWNYVIDGNNFDQLAK
jgi:hypothetical protein